VGKREVLKNRGPFNSALESGMRCLFLLEAADPRPCDLQRLVFYDYLLVHSGDVHGGPESLHPALPHRSGEWLVRRSLISRGLDLMFSRELVTKNLSPEGIHYRASALTRGFLTHLESPYSQAMAERARWVVKVFGARTDGALRRFMAEFKVLRRVGIDD